ncbi:hypothetical protein LXA43DRAFT_291346 [Ganoderma leucocontextum]|nr:hypothetical protein LXA43DRAFT_291346 [Ganoderma leucocontextum]
MPRHPNAYVRAAKLSETSAITDVLTRAFVNDPTMCFYGAVSALVKDPANPTPSEQKTIQALRVFLGAMLKLPMLLGGNVDVVAIPADHDGSSANPDAGKDSKERITAVAMWLPPGVSLDFSLPTIFRAGVHKVAFSWGLTSIKVRYRSTFRQARTSLTACQQRLGGDYTSAVEGTLAREFNARNLDRSDSWHVFMIAVDPDQQGAGYSSMLFKAGFRRASPTPIHLAASKPRNKDIYEHFGFELVETHVVGVGEVDANGIKARGEAAIGVPEFVMIKWTS